MKTVGVKFCGNCNPHVDAGEIYRAIQDQLGQLKECELVSKDTPGLDMLIVISGCPVDCAERPPGTYREVVAAGESVNRIGCAAAEIPGKVMEQLIKLCEDGISRESSFLQDRS